MDELNSFDAIKAFDIVDKTRTAYSFDRYGSEEWAKCVLFLHAQNYSLKAIEYILRSKHMRWASDQFGATKSGFIMYYIGVGNNSGKRLINEMLRDDLLPEDIYRTEVQS